MNQITIVGMGPGSKAYLTLEAIELLTKSDHVYLRTQRHPVVSELVLMGMKFKSFDDIYENSQTFDSTYMSIADQVIELSKFHEVIYAVPGNPFVAEKTVSLIIKACTDKGQAYKIVHGTSFLDAIITSLGYDPVKGLNIVDGLSIEDEEIIPLRDHLIIQVYNRLVASNVKLALAKVYPDDHEIIIIRGAGIPEEEVIKKIPLYELDRYPEYTDHLTSVMIPKIGEPYYGVHELLEIMKKLRGEDGCPWDREQTHESLVNYLIEEAYEVKNAVLFEDDTSLVDELGDVLLQVVFHTTMGEEEGYYYFNDVVKAVCEKMIRRHPHVFADVSADDTETVLENWQEIKNKEKSIESNSSAMREVTYALPNILRSQKIQKIASRAGFDWETDEAVMEKIEEELGELKLAMTQESSDRQMEEMGDLLMAISNLARRLGYNAEEIMQLANEKFIDRFEYVENQMIKKGLKLEPSQAKIMNELWIASKKDEKKRIINKNSCKS